MGQAWTRISNLHDSYDDSRSLKLKSKNQVVCVRLHPWSDWQIYMHTLPGGIHSRMKFLGFLILELHITDNKTIVRSN